MQDYTVLYCMVPYYSTPWGHQAERRSAMCSSKCVPVPDGVLSEKLSVWKIWVSYHCKPTAPTFATQSGGALICLCCLETSLVCPVAVFIFYVVLQPLLCHYGFILEVEMGSEGWTKMNSVGISFRHRVVITFGTLFDALHVFLSSCIASCVQSNKPQPSQSFTHQRILNEFRPCALQSLFRKITQ